MPNTGFVIAGAGANVAGSGTIAWSNPARITADDGSNTQAALPNNTISNYLHATSFGFSIPPGSTINGVQVRLQKQRTGGTVWDFLIQLIVNGARSGDNKGLLSTAWPTSMSNSDYGGTSDLWGLTLGAADINATNFGVAVQARDDPNGGSQEANIDAIWIAVEYTLPKVGCGLIESLKLQRMRLV